MKYIDADKLIALIDTKLEDLGLSSSVWVGRSVLQDLKNDIITSLQQEQPEIDLEKEIECSIRFLNGHHTLENGERWYKGRYEELRDFARHFYGLRNRALEEAARHIYKSWMGGTMNGVRNDMVELGKILNARKK